MCEETLNSLRRCSLKEAGGCGTYSDKKYSSHQMGPPFGKSDQVTLSRMSHRELGPALLHGEQKWLW